MILTTYKKCNFFDALGNRYIQFKIFIVEVKNIDYICNYDIIQTVYYIHITQYFMVRIRLVYNITLVPLKKSLPRFIK